MDPNRQHRKYKQGHLQDLEQLLYARMRGFGLLKAPARPHTCFEDSRKDCKLRSVLCKSPRSSVISLSPENQTSVVEMVTGTSRFESQRTGHGACWILRAAYYVEFVVVHNLR
jgi:hypothetical protein